MAIFVDVSYQSDLLGLSAGKAESPKLSLVWVLSELNYTMGFPHSVGENLTMFIKLYLSFMLDANVGVSYAS